ncbi:MAG: hypothetical protein KDB57_04605 [Solirubrobacterales bacterium]|nr:hypothetical protein [Solirubrobacterales bacterium]
MKQWLAGVVVLISGFVLVSSAGATVITVDSTVDGFGGTNCSLRNAFISADDDNPVGTCPRGDGDDVIRVPQGVYKLTNEGAGERKGITGDLDQILPGSITIRPATPGEKVTIDGIGSDRIFDHDEVDAGSLILEDIALIGGSVQGGEGDGGAIRINFGSVHLDGVTISGSEATRYGGAVAALGVTNLTMVNSTISGNQSGESGGGIHLGPAADGELRSITVAGNEADSDADGTGGGGGISTSADLLLVNSILAGNTDASPGPGDSDPDCLSDNHFSPRFVISSQAIGAGNCLTAPGPVGLISPSDPGLGALADNGGLTSTLAIAPGSPAIDAAGSSGSDLCPPTDQRGVIRPAGSCDLGSFEYDPAGAPALPLPGIARPTASTATFDGTNLYVQVSCAKKFKPKCAMTLTPLTAKKNGKALGAAVKTTVTSGGRKLVRLPVKASSRGLVEAMTRVDKRNLVVRQVVKSRKVGKRKPKKPATSFATFKVRVRI